MLEWPLLLLSLQTNMFQVGQTETKNPWFSANRVLDPPLPSLGIGSANILKQWDSLKSELKSLALLEADWDGYGAAPISETVVSNARFVLERLQASKWIRFAPEISPTASGTISLAWERDNIEAYLELGNTRYSGYIKSESQRPVLIEGGMDSFDATLLYTLTIGANRLISSAPPISRIKIDSFLANELMAV